MRWTPKEIERLLELAREPFLSSGQIGRELGKSRNAVISKLSRMGVPLPNAGSRNSFANRDSKQPPVDKRLKEYRNRQPTLPCVTLKAETFEEGDALKLSLTDLDHTKCKFITGEAHAHAEYCGHKTVLGKSWCPFHYNKVFDFSSKWGRQQQEKVFVQKGWGR